MPRPFLPFCGRLALSSSQALALSGAEMQRRTVTIAERYLAIWSSNDGGAVAGVPYMYGPTVESTVVPTRKDSSSTRGGPPSTVAAAPVRYSTRDPACGLQRGPVEVCSALSHRLRGSQPSQGHAQSRLHGSTLALATRVGSRASCTRAEA